MSRLNTQRPRVAALFSFLLAAAIAASLIWYSERSNLRENRARVASLALDHAHALESVIERALSLTYTLAALVRQGSGSISDFDAVASQMLRSYPSVSALELSPGGVIRQAVPLAGNEKAIGFDQFKDPLQRREALIARDTGRLMLAGPMDLVQGGLGVVGRLPVFLDDAMGKSFFWGFTNVVMRFPDVLVGARLPQLANQGVDYELWRIHPASGEKQVISASSDHALADPIEQNLELAYGNWTLSVRPLKGWADLPGLWLKGALGLIFSLLLAYAVALLVKLRVHQQELEHKIQERTQALARANESLAGREAEKETLLDNALVGIVMLRHRTIITCNRRFEEIFGYPAGAMLGQSTRILYASEEIFDTLGEQAYSTTISGQHFSGTLQMVRADGSLFWGAVTGRAIDAADPQEGSIWIYSDVTERRQTEEALKESEVRHRTLFEATPDAVLILDGGGIIDCNAATLGIFGARHRDEILGLQPGQLSPPTQPGGEDSSVQAERNIALALDTGSLAFEWAHRRLDTGTVFPAEVLLSAIEIEGRKLVQGTVRDITERKAAEAQLRKFSLAVEQSPESIVITNLNGEIEYVNEAFVQKTGYSREEVMGKNPRILKSGRTAPESYRDLWNALKQGKPWQGEFHNRHKDASEFIEHAVITPIRQAEGNITHYVAVKQDITARKEAEEKINTLALYDPLTNLPNRRLLYDRLRQALASSGRNDTYGALLFIDLDNFKALNDTLGHDIGDLLLQQVAQRLTTCIREGDSVARLGGDEFVVMLEDLKGNLQEAAAQTKIVGEKILATLNPPYQLASHPHHSTPSIGITLFANHHETIDDLMRQADLAMYQAKALGRNTLRFYDPEMQAVVTKRAGLEADLRAAVLKHQFLLYYQPQVVGEGRLTGVELLLRWQHPERGMVSPAEFIPLAEETGLILPIGRWVLDTACRQLALWATRPEMAHLTVAVNISTRQFSQTKFVEEVLAIIYDNGANPHRLKLELTESLLVEDVEDVIAKMSALKAKGVGFSLDDFGTGYSSLAYLKRMPLDQLKIDQSFVRDVLTSPNDAAIARMVIALAASMGLAVIAEGVEIEAQRDFLARHGCYAYQGYLFSRPVPLEEFEAFVKR